METLSPPPFSPPRDPAHSTHSSLREAILEANFVGELLRTLWCAGARQVELLRATVDCAGYDVVLDYRGVVRHIQLNSSYNGAKTARVDVNTALAMKPSGCVIWICFDDNTMQLGPFLWFGGAPGIPLPDLGTQMGLQSRGNSGGKKQQRPAMRVIRRSRFERVDNMEGLVGKLFGL
jgi:hypothetical protein